MFFFVLFNELSYASNYSQFFLVFIISNNLLIPYSLLALMSLNVLIFR